LALQFPDFDPVAVPIPAFPVGWLGQELISVAAAGVAAVAIGALFWHARGLPARGAGDPESPAESTAAVVLWNTVRTLLGVALAVLAASFAVRMFHVDIIGPFPVRWYALGYIAGILLGWRYGVSLVRNLKLWGPKTPTATVPQIDDLILWITLGIILGGRIGYILFYMLVDPTQRDHLLSHPLEAFEVWNGGMSFHGGFLGAALAIIVFARVNRIDLLLLGDLAAPCEPIGHFFVRIANFVNGELWGRVTHVPWGMVFCSPHIEQSNGGTCPADIPVPGHPDIMEHVARHPSQLYEAALEGLVMFIVLRLATHHFKWLQRKGAILGLWLAGYGIARTALETVRNPDVGMPDFPFGLTMGMMLSLPMLVLGLWLLWRAFHEKAPAEPAAPASP
jgi:phosphatidylglycerol:prolipoprotein diacylglycerol transferase